MNLQENIHRIRQMMGLVTENINEKEFNEIFNIQSNEANNLFIDEQPESEWEKYQESVEKNNTNQEKENLLKIPHKNIVIFQDSYVKVFLFDGDKAVVFAEFHKFNDGLQSKLIVKSKSSNISNLGVMLYEAIANDLKLPIYSDIRQTEASKRKIWFKLFQKYPERVFAYNIKTKKISKIINDKDDEFEPQVDNNPIYGDKYKGVKINTWGEEHPENQVIDWEPGGIDPFVSTNFPLDIMFQEKNLYLLKFIPA